MSEHIGLQFTVSFQMDSTSVVGRINILMLSRVSRAMAYSGEDRELQIVTTSQPLAGKELYMGARNLGSFEKNL